MNKLRLMLLVLMTAFALSPPTWAPGQSNPPKSPGGTQVPDDTKLTLDAAPPLQKHVIPSILYLRCKKTNMKGTAFVISGGVVVTAAHVLCGCEADDLEAITPLNRPVAFSNIVRDEDRDLAALRPKESLEGGLELATDTNAPIGERGNAWGFPLIYNGPAPLLTVGYLSGYYEAPEHNLCDTTHAPKDLKIKHVVVNAAFNPGNSGGPLFVFGQDKVIGIVIWKSITFSNQVKVAIEGFHRPAVSSMGTFSETLPDGTSKPLTDQEVIARVLEEFYTKVQVMIGEAISVSELRTFLKVHAKELSLTN